MPRCANNRRQPRAGRKAANMLTCRCGMKPRPRQPGALISRHREKCKRSGRTAANPVATAYTTRIRIKRAAVASHKYIATVEKYPHPLVSHVRTAISAGQLPACRRREDSSAFRLPSTRTGGRRHSGRSNSAGPCGHERLDRSWPGCDAYVTHVHLFTACGTLQHGINQMTAGSVGDAQGRPIRCGVLVAPLPHRRQHRPQVATPLGQAIVVTRRTIAVAHLGQHARFDQMVEALVEDVSRDTEPLLERRRSASPPGTRPG